MVAPAPTRGGSRSIRQGPDSGQRGQAIVELGLAAPLLVFLMLVAVDFGRVFHDYVSVVAAARAAAEVATDPSKGDSAVLTAALDEANGALGITASDVAVSPPFPRGAGTLVTITVTSTFTPITPIVSDLVGSSFQLRATARSRSY